MALLEINKETCDRCGNCAAICPDGIILYFNGKYPRPVSGADQFCMRCGHCITVCPTDSIKHAEMPTEQCPLIKDSLKISVEQCAQLIKGRRSIRKFEDKPVPREEIVRLIDIARFAPTGHNHQEICWLVIDDRDKLRLIEEIGLDWMRHLVKKSPAIGLMLEGVIKRMEAGGKDFIREAPALVIAYAEKNSLMAAIDAPIALGYFDLAANTAGLGCCWAGFFMMSSNTYPALVEAVALPEDQYVYGALMVGYPKYRYRRIPVRKPARIIWL